MLFTCLILGLGTAHCSNVSFLHEVFGEESPRLSVVMIHTQMYNDRNKFTDTHFHVYL